MRGRGVQAPDETAGPIKIYPSNLTFYLIYPKDLTFGIEGSCHPFKILKASEITW